MIEGTVDDDGVPLILLDLGDQTQAVIVDTGFNGDLELPKSFRPLLKPRFLTRIRSILAGGVSISEDSFTITLTFDGEVIETETTFSTGPLGLIGTSLFRDHRPTIDFVKRTLLLLRIDEVSA